MQIHKNHKQPCKHTFLNNHMLLLTDSIITFLCKLQQNMNDRNTVGKSYSPPLEKMMKATNPFQSNSQTIIKANMCLTHIWLTYGLTHYGTIKQFSCVHMVNVYQCKILPLLTGRTHKVKQLKQNYRNDKNLNGQKHPLQGPIVTANCDKWKTKCNRYIVKVNVWN